MTGRETAPPPLTEARNPATHDLDELSVPELVDRITDQDRQALLAVRAVREDIAHLVAMGVDVLRGGGRIHYFGAGLLRALRGARRCRSGPDLRRRAPSLRGTPGRRPRRHDRRRGGRRGRRGRRGAGGDRGHRGGSRHRAQRQWCHRLRRRLAVPGPFHRRRHRAGVRRTRAHRWEPKRTCTSRWRPVRNRSPDPPG